MVGMLVKMEVSDGVVYTVLFPLFGEKLKMLDFILRIVRMKSELDVSIYIGPVSLKKSSYAWIEES